MGSGGEKAQNPTDSFAGHSSYILCCERGSHSLGINLEMSFMRLASIHVLPHRVTTYGRWIDRE